MNIFTGLFPQSNPPTMNTQWLKAMNLELRYKKVLALTHSQKGKHIYKKTTGKLFTSLKTRNFTVFTGEPSQTLENNQIQTLLK